MTLEDRLECIFSIFEEDFFDNVYITNDGILAINDANWSNPKRKLSLIRNYKRKWRPFSRWGESTIGGFINMKILKQGKNMKWQWKEYFHHGK